jgi:SAM-dependent methyltransferase
MDEPDAHRPDPVRARSFDWVADAYDRARPSYPTEAVDWLVGRGRSRILELGAGTGKLTEQLLGASHEVVATDPSEPMLRRLVGRAPSAHPVLAAAEAIPLVTRCADAVVCAQAFHWFDLDRAIPEIARVLRPGGVLALVWNERDERIPWVKRLGALIGESPGMDDVARVIDDTGLFEQVETATFRFWQPLTRESLRDLVTSRSNLAVMSEVERERVLRKVDGLYDEYGRGADGMLLPYVTRAFRTAVLPWATTEKAPDGAGPDDVDTDSLLIDFR